MKVKSMEAWQKAIIKVLEEIDQKDGRAWLLSYQLARSLHLCDLLTAEVDRETFALVITETSREGDPREHVNEVVQVLARWHDQVRKDMDALLLTLQGKAKFIKETDDTNPFEELYARFSSNDESND